MCIYHVNKYKYSSIKTYVEIIISKEFRVLAICVLAYNMDSSNRSELSMQYAG